MNTLYQLTAGGFVAVTVIYIAILLVIVHRALQKTNQTERRKRRTFILITACILAWTVIISVLAAIGFFEDFTTVPPRFVILVVIPLITIVWTTSRPGTREILRYVRPSHLLHLQSFRVFVEILLWMLFVDNLLPFQMTFEGYNFDILAGLTGPIIGYAIQRNRSSVLMVIWNWICLGLLVNIVTIAILSAPVPFRVFMNEPANTIVTKFPVVWLPGLLVPLAYTLHILSLRQAGMLKDGKL